jgi:hypothetical protein
MSHRLRDQRIIHDTSLVYPEASDTGHLRLVFPDLLWSETADRHGVRAAALLENRQARQLVLSNGHDQLAASTVRYVLFLTKPIHVVAPFATGTGF